MTLPNFLIIGAAKAGTTSLYNYLEQHPDVFMSADKEPRFFAFEGDESGSYPYTNLAEYEKLFKNVSNEKAVGEASSYYLCSESAPICIKKHVPDVKLIAILRNPADRAYSHFVYWRREGKEHEENFDIIVKNELKSMETSDKSNYLSRGMYGEQIQAYLNVFSKDQMRFYLFEDLRDKPAEMLKDVFRFLDLDDAFKVDFSRTYNVSTVPQSGIKQILYAFIVRQNRIRNMLIKILPDYLFWKVITPFSRSVTGILRSKKRGVLPPLDISVRKQLIKIYKDDILKTEKLIGRNLRAWIK